MVGFLPAAGAALGQMAVNKIFGGGSSGAAKEARHYAWEQQQMAKENFYSGIQVRLADAKKAGVHALAALGFNPANTAGPNISASSDSGGSGLSGEVGSSLGRAVSSLFNKDERMQAKRLTDIQLEGAELDNAYKRAQLALLTQQGSQPGLPAVRSADSAFPHAGDIGQIEDVPTERMGYDGSAREAGPLSGYNVVKLPDGRTMAVPSKDAKDRIDDVFLKDFEWWLKAEGGPAFKRSLAKVKKSFGNLFKGAGKGARSIRG